MVSKSITSGKGFQIYPENIFLTGFILLIENLFFSQKNWRYIQDR